MNKTSYPRRRCRSVTSLLALSLIALIAAAFGCAGGGSVGSSARSIEGFVLGVNGEPLVGVTVTALDSGAQDQTDFAGMFRLEDDVSGVGSSVLEFERAGQVAQATLNFGQALPEISLVEVQVVFDERIEEAAVIDVEVTDIRPATPTSAPIAPTDPPASSSSSSSSSAPAQPTERPAATPTSQTSPGSTPPPAATATAAPPIPQPTAQPIPTIEPTPTAEVPPTSTPLPLTPTATPTATIDPCLGDVDGDRDVDLDDLLTVLGAQGTQPGDPGYVPGADVDRDGDIDGDDVTLVQNNFTASC